MTVLAPSRRLARAGALASALALGAALVVAPASTAGAAGQAPARATFTRTVEPWDEGDKPAETAVPVVDLTAACVRLAGGKLEAVFGYDNPGGTAIAVPLAADNGLAGGNVIVRDTWRLRPPHRTTAIEDLGPQVTLFKPGAHPHGFAVRFNVNEQVAWQVKVPSTDGPDHDAGFKVTVRPRLLAPCGSNVPAHFSVVQRADVLTPTPVNETFDVFIDGGTGLVVDYITAYDVRVGLANVRVACSAGGQVVGVDPVFGWLAPSNVRALGAEDDVFEPVVIPPSGGHGGAVFEMTTTSQRSVAVVTTPLRWLGPIADVTARCAFGSNVIGSDVFWAETAGAGTIQPRCLFSPDCVDDFVVTHLDVSLEAPGGSRLR